MFPFDLSPSESCLFPWSHLTLSVCCSFWDSITILLEQSQAFSAGSLKPLRQAVTTFLRLQSTPELSGRPRGRPALATAKGRSLLVTWLIFPLQTTGLSRSLSFLSSFICLTCQCRVFCYCIPGVCCVLLTVQAYRALTQTGLLHLRRQGSRLQLLLCDCPSSLGFPAKQSCGGPCNVRRAS